jgi:hypothetical protein
MAPYDFLNIQDFTAGSNMYRYGDPTPGSMPGPSPEGDVPLTDDPPPRCGSVTHGSDALLDDENFVKFEASGENFWGAGFADWGHNDEGARQDGSAFDGISFWARSPRNFEKTFLFGIDDPNTIIDPPNVPDPPDTDPVQAKCRPLPKAGPMDQDLDGDGCIGPGDIADGTNCRLPPSSEIGTAVCYNGSVDSPPSGGARVPVADECGNQFHTWITTSETWQLFLIPWSDLVQWPCPNRVEGGFDRAHFAKFEIKVKQGMRYQIWFDNLAFYKRR